MRTNKRLIITAALLVLACHQEMSAQQTLQWAPTIDVAQQVAARQNQLVLVHFWSPTCAPCIRMEQTVFTDPQVIRLVSSEYVPVKINVDESPAIAGQYGIQQMPTDVVLNSVGQVVFRGPSPASSAEFIGHYQQLAHQQRASGAMLAQASAYQNSGYQTSPSLPGSDNRFSQPIAGYNPANATVTSGTSGTTDYAASTPPNWQNNAASNGFAPGGAQQSGSRYSNPQTSISTTPTVGGPAGPVTGPSSYAGNPPATPPVFVQPNGAAFGTQAPPANYVPSTPPSFNGISQNQVTATNPANFSPPVAQPPAGNPPTGMDGYCPVTLSEQSRWQLGDVRWGAVHRGRTYLFAGPSEQQRFLANPDFYAPMLSGHDPVQYIEGGKLIGGTRQHGVFYRQQVYLFSSEETLDRFWKAPEQYHAAAYQAMRQADSSRFANRPSDNTAAPR